MRYPLITKIEEEEEEEEEKHLFGSNIDILKIIILKLHAAPN